MSLGLGQKNYLYIDTSHHLVVGLLGDTLEFLDLLEFPETKSSGILHENVLNILQRHQIAPLELKGLVQAAGPGSYTGMRLSHGMAQIFQWQGVECYGFYHFEVPRLLGVREGNWMAKAFKGEVFHYYWTEKGHDSSLLPEREFEHFQGSQSLASIDSYQSTHQMVVEQSPRLFHRVIRGKMKRSPYYFRPLEKEFRKPNI